MVLNSNNTNGTSIDSCKSRCSTRMCLLEPPVTYIGAVLFTVGCLTAAVANVICLIILWAPKRKTRSNKLLICLALSDVLVGLVVFPLNAYQMVDSFGLKDTTVDSIRIYIAVFLEGSSVLTLAVIALDRYIMMTKMSLYNKTSTQHLTVGLIIFSWLFSATAPAIRWVNREAYLVVLITIFVVPFFILLISYVFITKALRRQQRKLRKQHVQSFRFQDISNYPESEQRNTSTSQKQGISTQATIADAKLKLQSQKNLIKVTKAVSFLLVVYFCCITPKNVWMVVFLIDRDCQRVGVMNHQYLYLAAMVAVSYNSCFNPLVYFAKNPEIQKGFRKLFKIKKRPQSSDSQTTGISN